MYTGTLQEGRHAEAVGARIVDLYRLLGIVVVVRVVLFISSVIIGKGTAG